MYLTIKAFNKEVFEKLKTTKSTELFLCVLCGSMVKKLGDRRLVDQAQLVINIKQFGVNASNTELG